MRYIVLLCSLVVSSFSYSSISFQHAKELFAKLGNSTGYHLVLGLNKGLYINAYTNNYNITVTQGLLNFCKTDNELILVLGHELGHWARQDPRQTTLPIDMESKADAYGNYFCNKLGYKECLKFMYRIRARNGEGGGDGVHPGWSGRIRYIKHHSKLVFKR